jgi:hypothetical protein
MARGDLTVFEEFSDQLGKESHNFSSDVLKCGIIDNTLTPLATIATPTWGDYSANEVATTGGYPAGGETIASVTFTEVAGVSTLDGADVVVSQNGSGFTNGYWTIIYNDTEATDMAICFIDLGGPVSEVDGDITISFNVSGILTITVS